MESSNVLDEISSNAVPSTKAKANSPENVNVCHVVLVGLIQGLYTSE